MDMIPKEAEEGCALFQWAQYRVTIDGFRLSDYLIHIPNGAVLAGDAGQRARAMNKWKLQGLRIGCADYFLALPSRGFHGLWIELKRQKSTPSQTSEDQRKFLAAMVLAGFDSAVCKGWLAASVRIDEYLTGASHPIGNTRPKAPNLAI